MKRFTLIFLGLLTTYSLSAQSADLQPAATVNLIRTEPITVRQLKNDVERMEKSARRTLSQAERMQILDVVINERLVLQAAERDRVIISDNEVTQQMQQFRSGMQQQLGRQPTDAEFSQAIMNESGLDANAFRDQLRRQMIVQKYLMAKKGETINSVKQPTDQEIINEYNLLKSQLVRPDTIRFSMIQVQYGPDAASRTKARTLADSLVKEINSDPSKFDEVAARSVAPSSGYQAGDAGYLPRNQEARQLVGQTFMDVAFALKQGQVSRLIEGQQGFQIIKVTENYASKSLELSDIFQLGSRATVRDYIAQTLYNQRQQAALAQASQELVTELRTGKTFQIFENNIKW